QPRGQRRIALPADYERGRLDPAQELAVRDREVLDDLPNRGGEREEVGVIPHGPVELAHRRGARVEREPFRIREDRVDRLVARLGLQQLRRAKESVLLAERTVQPG